MSAVEQFDQLVEQAEKLGYRIRYDYFGGTGGGLCEFGGATWIFVDLALPPHEQLELMQESLSKDPRVNSQLADSKAA